MGNNTKKSLTTVTDSKDKNKCEDCTRLERSAFCNFLGCYIDKNASPSDYECNSFNMKEKIITDASTVDRIITSDSHNYPEPIESVIDGVGSEAPLITNEKGGVSSESPYRMDLLPMLSLLEVAKVLKHGCEKYGKDNWKKLSVEDHINHALVHIAAHTVGDIQDKHLVNAACRMLFALEVFVLSKRNVQVAKENKTKQKENESKT